MSNAQASDRYLSVPRVCDKLSRGRTWLFETSRTDPTFPQPYHIHGRKVFSEAEIDAWVKSQTRRGEEVAA